MSALLPEPSELSKSVRTRKPRLGFLGIGWIGRHRMEAIAKSGFGEIVAVADGSPEAMNAPSISRETIRASSLDELLELDLDGIVIATPSALHADQTIRALEDGVPVFCQKPLARNLTETRRVIDVAKKANQLLGVDLSYRHIRGVGELRKLLRSGKLGKVFAADLVFHITYGPDKSWFYNRQLSGGGCVIDLGIHLVDLALWSLGFPEVERVTSRLFSASEPMEAKKIGVEDFANARLDLDNGAALQLACSWKLPAGCEAIIRASFYGTNGGVELRNVNGSVYDFVVEEFSGTRRAPIATSQENWGGHATVEWACQLSEERGFDPEIEHAAKVASVLDQIYANSPK